jgi:hypothetical protein
MMAGTMEGSTSSAPPALAAAEAPAPEPVPVGTPCSACERPLADQFFVRNGDVICAACLDSEAGSFREALALGLGAAVLDIALYYAIVFLFHWRFLFIAVIAGVLIGTAVRRGARASTLLRYRWLAVVLTYVTVAATYAHALAEMSEVSGPVDAVLRSLYLPLVMLVWRKNLVTLILLGFGVHEAWKFSAPPYVLVEGPFPTTPA